MRTGSVSLGPDPGPVDVRDPENTRITVDRRARSDVPLKPAPNRQIQRPTELKPGDSRHATEAPSAITRLLPPFIVAHTLRPLICPLICGLETAMGCWRPPRLDQAGRSLDMDFGREFQQPGLSRPGQLLRQHLAQRRAWRTEARPAPIGREPPGGGRWGAGWAREDPPIRPASFRAVLNKPPSETAYILTGQPMSGRRTSPQSSPRSAPRGSPAPMVSRGN